MEFHCTHCGCKLTVPETHRGKKGRCPKCKETLTVPNAGAEQKSTPHDMRLLDIPQPEEAEGPTTGSDESAAAYEQLRGSLGGRLMDPEEIPERKYPWIVDIFLYPLNLPALTMLLICVGIPFLLRVMVTFFRVATGAMGILIIFWVISLMVHWGALLLLITYMFWHFGQCIRDSAEGQIRAAETLAETPGLGELAGQTLRLIFCALLCLAPVIVMWTGTGDVSQLPWILCGAGNFFLPIVLPVEVLRRIASAEQTIPLIGSMPSAGPAFWILWGAGNFLFPMLVLAMAMRETFFSVLNPIPIVRSILRTFFPYCALALTCCVLSLSLSTIYYLILSPQHWHLAYALLALAFYQMLVMAHLLGRFFFKYQEKLDWDA